MKTIRYLLIYGFFISLAYSVFAGGMADPRDIKKTDLSLRPSQNQAELIFSYSEGGAGSLFVSINDVEKAQSMQYSKNSETGEITENGLEKVIVTSGVQHIRLLLKKWIRGDANKGTKDHWENRTSIQFDVTANPMTSTTIEVSSQSQLISSGNYEYSITYNIKEVQTLDNSGIEGALTVAVKQLVPRIPKDATIAIVYINADDKGVVEYIAGELEFQLFSLDYILVGRRQLDILRKEQDFGLSGYVSDETAISIGQHAGASIIITGTIDGTGSLRRLRLRAVDTKTSRISSIASVSM